MFILQNAIKNIYRYRSKYLLIGIVLFIVVLIASVLIGIFNYATVTTDALKNKYAGVVRVSKGMHSSVTDFNRADYEWFQELDYVKQVHFNSYIMSTRSMGHYKYDITEDHRKLMSPEEYEAKIKEPPVATVEITVKGEAHTLRELQPNYVYIMGYNYDTLTDDKKERFVIESGRMYENDDECVIAKNPLLPEEEWNLLGVGDTIRISKHTGVSKEYTVVGILQAADNLTEETKTRVLFTTFDSAEAFGNATIPGKDVPSEEGNAFSTQGPVNNPIEPNMGMPLHDEDIQNLTIERYEVAVDLESHAYYNTFVQYVSALGDGYFASSFYENYSSLLGVLNQSYAWSVLFIVIIAVILVFMTVFTTIFHLSSRKYEIAVLRSVGMKKSRLILSFLLENLVFVWGITVLALLISQITQPVFLDKAFAGLHTMLTADVLQELTETTGLSLFLRNTGIVFGGMTFTVILSLVLVCINIVRFQPLKIFNKQY